MKKDKMQKQDDLITQKLKTLYTSIEEEAVPDKFVQMLEKLEQAEQAELQKKTVSKRDD